MITRIHVNQAKIRANRKVKQAREPVITVKDYKKNRYAHEVVIKGPCRVLYRPCSPLKCGATVWIETEAEVEIVEEVA